MKKIKAIFLTAILSLTSLAGFYAVIKTAAKVKADANIIPSGQTLDNVVDTISVSDLTFNGLTNQTIVRENVDTDITFAPFSEENINKNLVFKFKYDVVDDNNSDSNAFRFHFDVSDYKWDADNSLWIRGDGTYFKNYNNGSFEWYRLNALSLGIHEIEYGRIAILNENNNNPTGNYYVYYKLDGNLKKDCISPFNLSKMNEEMFFNYSSGNTSNKVYDIRYTPGPYEVADRISISDLQKGGLSIGETVLLDDHHTYSYVATAPHKSVIFDFLYETKDLATIDCQFHLSDTWLGNSHGGIVWLRDDKNRISKAGGGYVETSPFNALGIYKVQISKLYIESGENVGKYYISLAVNGSKVLEYVIADMPDVAAVFTTGTNDDMLYDINYMPIELDTDLYLYKWDVNQSGIKFNTTLRKDLSDVQQINNIGFILTDNQSNKTKIPCKLVNKGSYYEISCAIAALNLSNITNKYSARLYYSMPNLSGINKTYYSKEISTTFYNELDDLSALSAKDQQILNAIKANVLNITLDEDNCNVTGATKSGDFSSNSITLTGSNPTYTSYVINNEIISNNDLIKFGYRTYKASINNNVITLTKQTKKVMFGGSEHFHEINSGHDENMTAINLSPMASNLGLKTIRLDIDFGDLFRVTNKNELIVNYGHVSKIQGIIDELKTNGGIEDFLAVFWVVQPYGFKNWNDKPWASKTAPNPSTQSEMYLKWLEMNGEAAKIAAQLFPDIHSFETWNEAEIMSEADGPLARPDGSNYSVTEKAKILTDLMYYYNKGIKQANPNNILTSPSLCCSQQTDSEFDVTSPNFLNALYQAISDATPVTGYNVVDTEPNNYFQAINIHPYLARGTNQSNWNNFVNSFHTISNNYGDGGTPIWVTEFGFAQNRESNVSTKMNAVLNCTVSNEYITKFYFYKIHDYTEKIDSDKWGLYNNDGTIKSIGTSVKNFIASH